MKQLKNTGQKQYYKAELGKYSYFRICLDPICSAVHFFKQRPTVAEIKAEFVWCYCGYKTVMINSQQILKQTTLERIGCTLPITH